MTNPKIYFDVPHLYYLPQYLSVLDELKKHSVSCCLVFYTPKNKILKSTAEQIIRDSGWKTVWVDNCQAAKDFYKKESPNWIIFGNAVNDIEEIHQHSQSALINHGIGPKACYYDVSNNQTTVRFVEGAHRLNRLKKLYPKGCFVDTGFAKLDLAFNQNYQKPSIQQLGLDPEKKTLLYAPTFFPSSIEAFSTDFPTEFKNYNIILKPHFFSLTKRRYSGHARILKKWNKQSNVYLAELKEYNLLPLMLIADALISDASSAIFEFAALDKPILWCNFHKLRWTYRGPLKFRLGQRLDEDINFFEKIAEKVENYDSLMPLTKHSLENPDIKSSLRKQITYELAGLTDGKCAQRITQYLLAHL